MTFDPIKPHKNVDGVNINLTDYEIAEWEKHQAAFVPPAPPVPDLATQLAAALIAKGTIAAEDLHEDTLATVNLKINRGQL